MELYQIIQALREEKSNNAKIAILEANKENEVLKQYMKAMLDPAINYYQTKIAIPKDADKVERTVSIIGIHCLQALHDIIAKRMATGREAKDWLSSWYVRSTDEVRELLTYLIKRKIDGANVGDSMVLGVWPELYFVPPYMRCASMSDKVKEHYKTLPYFFVQTKRDGSFAYLLKSPKKGGKAVTRQGNLYPSWFAEKMSEGVPAGFVLVGEMEVYQRKLDGYVLMSRKDGNGVLNSVQHSEDDSEFKEYQFKYVAWDMLTIAEFMAGKSDRDYEVRLQETEELVAEVKLAHLQLCQTWKVSSVAEANQIHQKHIRDGKEGTVWKTPDGAWRDSSSGTKDAVKNKLVFEVELEVTGWYEGEGKAAGMLGGLTVATSCRKLTNNVGSGFSDKQRKEIWDAIQKGDTPMGWIVTLEANDVQTAKGKTTFSLSLPIFIERRLDKKEADSLERVLEQLEAAKQGK